ncbi:MAG: dipicolinate synthase subunit B [Limnochordia bacterium]|jgi:dipicolinate synthase subunit B
MYWKDVRIGFALTGSYCTFEATWPQLERLVALGAQVTPIISWEVAKTDSRFCRAADVIKRLRELTGKEPIASMVEAEPLGPQRLLDVVVIAPCTGNTMAKLANAITDSPVLMAAKGHLRNGRPVVVAISTNDGLSGNAKNLGLLLNTRNIYLVPFGQDNPLQKERSLVAKMELLLPTIEGALEGRQIQPILVEYKGETG